MNTVSDYGDRVFDTRSNVCHHAFPSRICLSDSLCLFHWLTDLSGESHADM